MLLAAVSLAQRSSLQDQIAQHEQKLAAARASGSLREEATELNFLGMMYRQAGKPQKALEDLNAVLPIEQRAGNQAAQAMTENTMGRVYTDLGQEDKALALFNQALPVWRTLRIRQAEANTLNYMGKSYDNLGQREEALKNLNASLSIWRELDNGQAKTQVEQNHALPQSWRETGGRAGEAATLDNLGTTYSDMGQGTEALDYFNQARPSGGKWANRAAKP